MKRINDISSFKFMEINNPKNTCKKKAVQGTYNHEKRSKYY